MQGLGGQQGPLQATFQVLLLLVLNVWLLSSKPFLLSLSQGEATAPLVALLMLVPQTWSITICILDVQQPDNDVDT